MRTQLAATLQGVVCQTLVKRASGTGRVVATEVLVTTTGDRQPHPRGQDLPDRRPPCRRAGRSACTPWTSTSPSSSTPAQITHECRPREGARPRRRSSDMVTASHGVTDRRRSSDFERCTDVDRSPDLRLQGPGRRAARSSRASSRRRASPPSISADAHDGALARSTVAAVGRRHRVCRWRSRSACVREGRQPQGPRRHEPSDGDDGRRGPLAPAHAHDPLRADREHEARQDARHRCGVQVETGSSLSDAFAQARPRSSRRS